MMEALLEEIKKDLLNLSTNVLNLNTNVLNLNTKFATLCSTFKAQCDSSHRNPASRSRQDAPKEHVVSEQDDDIIDASLPASPAADRQAPEIGASNSQRRHRKGAAPKHRLPEEEAVQNDRPVGDIDADIAQLAASDLQNKGLPNDHQEQQAEMETETTSNAAQSSGPATTSVKPPEAQPAPHIQIPGPRPVPQSQHEPLETRRRYMIDNEDDLDLVEAGAGNRKAVAAPSASDDTRLVSEDQEAERDSEETLDEEDALDFETRFLSVTRHCTDTADRLLVYGNLPGCSKRQDQEDIECNLQSYPQRCAITRRMYLEGVMAPTLFKTIAEEFAQQGVADIARAWAQDVTPGDFALEDTEADLQGLAMRVAEQNADGTDTEEDDDDLDSDPDDTEAEGDAPITMVFLNSSSSHPDSAGGGKIAATHADDLATASAADLMAIAEAQAKREEQVESLMARIMHAGIPLLQQLSQAQIRAMVLSILPTASAGCTLSLAAQWRQAANDILAATAINVEIMANTWTVTTLDALQAAACFWWSKESSEQEQWVCNLDHSRNRLADMLKKLIQTHADNPRAFLSSAAKQLQILELTVHECLYNATLLDISQQEEQPLLLEHAAELRVAGAAASKAAAAAVVAAAAAAAAGCEVADEGEPIEESGDEMDHSEDDEDTGDDNMDDFIVPDGINPTPHASSVPTQADKQAPNTQADVVLPARGQDCDEAGEDETERMVNDAEVGAASGSRSAYKPHTEILVEDARMRQHLATAAMVGGAAGAARSVLPIVAVEAAAISVAASTEASAAASVAAAAAAVSAAASGSAVGVAAVVAMGAASARVAQAAVHAATPAADPVTSIAGASAVRANLEAGPATAAPTGSPGASPSAPEKPSQPAPHRYEVSDDEFDEVDLQTALAASLATGGAVGPALIIDLADSDFDEGDMNAALAASLATKSDDNDGNMSRPVEEDRHMSDADADAAAAMEADAVDEGVELAETEAAVLPHSTHLASMQTAMDDTSPAPTALAGPSSKGGINVNRSNQVVGGSMLPQVVDRLLGPQTVGPSPSTHAAVINIMGTGDEEPVGLTKTCLNGATVRMLPGLLPQPLSVGLAVELNSTDTHGLWRWWMPRLLKSWNAGSDMCMVKSCKQSLQNSGQVPRLLVRPAPPSVSSLPQVQLTRGELVELRDPSCGDWKTGVILSSRLRHIHHFKWASNFICSSGSVHSCEDSMKAPCTNESESLDSVIDGIRSQRHRTERQHTVNDAQQPAHQLQSANPADSGGEGLVCNRILTPCKPSSCSSLHSIVYVQSSVTPVQRGGQSGTVFVCGSSSIAQGNVRPCLWWDPESAHWHSVSYPGNSLLRRGRECLQGTRDKQQKAQLERQMHEYDASLRSSVTTSAAAPNPSAIAAAESARLVHQGHCISRMLARRPTAKYSAVLPPKKQAVRTLPEGFAPKDVKGPTQGRPFKHKRLLTAATVTDPDQGVPISKTARKRMPILLSAPAIAVEKPDSARDLAKDDAVKDRMAVRDAKKARAQQAMLLATSHVDEEDDDMPLLDDDDEEEEDGEWVPLFGRRPNPKGLPIPKLAKFYADCLKPHQLKGLQFIWHNLVEEDPTSIYGIIHPDAKPDDMPGGAILAHHMGLGKTLTTIAFLHTYFAAAQASSLSMAKSQGVTAAEATGCGRALLVVPANVLETFFAEFSTWLPKGPESTSSPLTKHKVYMYSPQKPKLVTQWYQQQGSVLIITSKMFAKIVLGDIPPAISSKHKPRVKLARREQQSSTDDDDDSAEDLPTAPPVIQLTATKLATKHMRDQQREMFIKGPSVMVVDEAHELRNPLSQLCMATFKVETNRRIALTGYPLQNNLNEYYAMINWVSPDLLGTDKKFKEEFVTTIENGQLYDATAGQRKRSAMRLSVLHDLVSDIIHRAGPDLLTKELPAKTEHVLQLRLSPLQEELYALYQMASRSGRKLLCDISMMDMICNTPEVFETMIHKAATERQALQVQVEDEEGLLELYVSPSQAEASLTQATSHGPGGGQAATPMENGKGKTKKVKRERMSSLSPHLCLEMHKLICKHRSSLSLPQLGEGSHREQARALGKVWTNPKQAFISALLRQCKASGEKVVLFSMSLTFLNSVEQCLQTEFDLTLSHGYFRIDGSVNAKARSNAITSFNASKGFKVMILSTRAGSLGINLVSACRLVLADVGWNPVWNAQAVARVFRFGQLKPTFIYRLLYNNTFEQYILKVNIRKEELFQKVVDEKAIKKAGLWDVYAEVYSPYEQPAAIMPMEMQDQLEAAKQVDTALAAVARHPRFSSWIAGYSTHASHFESDPEAALGKEDRMLATAEFIGEGTQLQPYAVAGEEGFRSSAAPEQSKRLRKLTRKRRVIDSDEDEDYLPPSEDRNIEQERAAAAAAAVRAHAAVAATRSTSTARNAATPLAAAPNNSSQFAPRGYATARSIRAAISPSLGRFPANVVTSQAAKMSAAQARRPGRIFAASAALCYPMSRPVTLRNPLISPEDLNRRQILPKRKLVHDSSSDEDEAEERPLVSGKPACRRRLLVSSLLPTAPKTTLAAPLAVPIQAAAVKGAATASATSSNPPQRRIPLTVSPRVATAAHLARPSPAPVETSGQKEDQQPPLATSGNKRPYAAAEKLTQLIMPGRSMRRPDVQNSEDEEYNLNESILKSLLTRHGSATAQEKFPELGKADGTRTSQLLQSLEYQKYDFVHPTSRSSLARPDVAAAPTSSNFFSAAYASAIRAVRIKAGTTTAQTVIPNHVAAAPSNRFTQIIDPQRQGKSGDSAEASPGHEALCRRSQSRRTSQGFDGIPKSNDESMQAVPSKMLHSWGKPLPALTGFRSLQRSVISQQLKIRMADLSEQLTKDLMDMLPSSALRTTRNGTVIISDSGFEALDDETLRNVKQWLERTKDRT